MKFYAYTRSDYLHYACYKRVPMLHFLYSRFEYQELVSGDIVYSKSYIILDGFPKAKIFDTINCSMTSLWHTCNHHYLIKKDPF